MDRLEGLPVVLEAGTAAGKRSGYKIGETARGCLGRVGGRGVLDRLQVRRDLCGLVAGGLGLPVRQPVEPATGPRRAGEDGLGRPDVTRGAVGGDRGGGPKPPGGHVAQKPGKCWRSSPQWPGRHRGQERHAPRRDRR
jgi:hypothetical protein